MKLFLLSLALVAAVSAAPDELLKLGELSSAITNKIEEVKAEVAPSADPITTSTQGTAEDRTRLLATLFKDYNKKVNPDNVTLSFGLSLISFNPCLEKNILDSYVWLRYDWTDDRLAWNPDEYGGATVLRLTADDIWKPDVTLYNSADPVNMVNCWHSNVLIWNNGHVLWVPPCKMTSNCLFDVKQPYGEQVCTLKFGSWTFDGNIVDIQFYKGSSTIDLSDMIKNSAYDVVSTSGVRNVKHYACCVEAYPDLTFNVTLKRIPGDELFKRY